MQRSRTLNNGAGGEGSVGSDSAARAETSGKFSRMDLYRRYAIVVILIAQMAFWTVMTPAFLTGPNLMNVARQAAFVGVVAVGMTFVIIAAGIDLSVGSLVAFAPIVAASVMEQQNSGVLGIAITLGVGLASGIFVGFVVSKLGIPAFITTLAMLAVLKSGALLWRDGQPISIDNDAFRSLGSGFVGSVPIPIIVFAATYLLGHWVLSNTKYGRHVYAIGGNERAARLAGIRVDRHIVSVYAVSGLLAGLGSIIIAGRLGTATPLAGDGLELDVIAAVIVGGTSLFGGVGTLWGTLAGVLIIAFLRNGLTLIGVSGFWQLFATGVVILGAVLLDRVLSYHRSKAQ